MSRSIVMLTAFWTVLVMPLCAQQRVSYFIALDIPAKQEAELASQSEKVRSYLYGKFEPSEKYHITLKFLGRLDSERLSTVIEQLKNVVSHHKPFTLEVTGLGFFPSIDKARVAWLGAHATQLKPLQRDIAAVIAKLGIHSDDRFNPHITLARLSCTPPSWLLKKLRHEIGDSQSSFVVKHVYLYKSQGGKYIPIAIAALGNENN